MIRSLAALLTAVLVLGTARSSDAAYLDESPSSSSPPRQDRWTPVRPADPPIIMPPHPQPVRPGREALERALEGLDVGWPQSHEALVIYPLKRRDLDLPDALSLREADGRGWIEMAETGQVSALSASNSGDRHVFFLAGQMVRGGMQNRTVAEDIFLGPWQRGVMIPVFCIEKGRWQGPSPSFAPSPSCVPQNVRKEAMKGASQDRVWNEVERASERLGVQSDTGDMDEMMARGGQAGRFQGALDALGRVFEDRSVGFVACCGNRILGLELFGSHRLFMSVKDELLMGYAAEAWGERVPWWQGSGKSIARRFIEDLSDAGVSARPSPADGWAVLVEGERVQGRGLALGSDLVHLTAW